MNVFRAVLVACLMWSPLLSQVVIKSGPSEEAPKISTSELTEKLGKYLQDLATKDEFSGVVLLAKDGEPAFHRAYGLASKEYGVPNNPETKFNLGSIDKVFTRIAIGLLIERGKIASVDDKLEKYLPDYPNHEAASKVTLRQLVNMQSGIGDFFGPRFSDSPKDKFRTIADFLPLCDPAAGL